ncbi:MAG: HAD-IIB family hydrolase [Cyanobacteria bacterium J06638_20]
MKKLLVFTDLDATLLDHETYSYAPALSAIARLQQDGHVLILNSSKTQAEQAALREELGNTAPFVVENGAAIACPPNTPGHREDSATATLHVLAADYAHLRDVVCQLRQDNGYGFRGFGDMAADDIAQITGLSLTAAEAAKQRNGSEPLLWEDTDDARSQFVAQVNAAGLQVTQGGRFLHVMGKTDKGAGVQWLSERYRQSFPDILWQVVALGDSPNDLPMLRVADVGVLIPNPHRKAFAVEGVARLLKPEQPGPKGWAVAIAQLLDELGDC